MQRHLDNLARAEPPADPAWLARCAHRLRTQWPHADPLSLDEAAAELWLDPALRALDAREAAEAWLRRGVLARDPVDG